MTKIEWLKAGGRKGVTWNPVTGCTKVSPGCDNCYAEKMAWRLANHPNPDISERYHPVVSGVVHEGGWLVRRPHWTGKILCHEDLLDKPLHWKKPRNIFVCSMSDLFHEDVPDEFIDRVRGMIYQCRLRHLFLILTKRPRRMSEIFNWPCAAAIFPKLWLGVTVEKEGYQYRIDHLRRTPAAVRFLSIEPLLGSIGILPHLKGIGWVIVGAESGPKRREMKLEWVRDIVDQCKVAGTPVFIKQLHIDGKLVKDIQQFPKDLRIREYPK